MEQRGPNMQRNHKQKTPPQRLVQITRCLRQPKPSNGPGQR